MQGSLKSTRLLKTLRINVPQFFEEAYKSGSSAHLKWRTHPLQPKFYWFLFILVQELKWGCSGNSGTALSSHLAQGAHSHNTQSLPYTRNKQHIITSSSRLPIANNADGTPRHERCNIMYCHYQKKAEWCLETLLCINWLIIEKASHPVQPIEILTKLLPLTPYNLSLCQLIPAQPKRRAFP